MKINRRKFLESSSMLLSAGALSAAGATASAGEAAPPQGSKKKYRLIATEEAFASPEQAQFFRSAAATEWADPDVNMWRGFLNNQQLLGRLLDLEKERAC